MGSGKQRALETCKTASIGPVPQKPRAPRKTGNGRRNLGCEISSQLRGVHWEKVILGWPKSSFRIENPKLTFWQIHYKPQLQPGREEEIELKRLPAFPQGVKRW